ncbi:MAG TPA: hypothetical protein VF039_00935 [Longimicrobiales bacterium]
MRIPRELQLPGDEALIRRDGDRLILEPVPPTVLLDLLATLEPLDDAFDDVDDLPPDLIEL